jgi:phage-related holin
MFFMNINNSPLHYSFALLCQEFSFPHLLALDSKIYAIIKELTIKVENIFIITHKNMSSLLDALALSQVQVIIVLVAIDVVLGVVAAFIKKEFVLGKVAGFMQKGVVSFAFGFAVLAAIGQAFPSLAFAITVAYWLVVLALLGSILDNLAKLGIPMPRILRK